MRIDEYVPLLRLLAGDTVAFQRSVPLGERGTLDLTWDIIMGLPSP